MADLLDWHPSSPQRPGPSFLTLHTELRLQIYTLCFLLPSTQRFVSGQIWPPGISDSRQQGIIGTVDPTTSDFTHTPQSTRPSFPVALLRTCRQVHAEAAPVFYGENTWIRFHGAQMLDRNGVLESVYLPLIRHIEMRIQGRSSRDPIFDYWPAVLRDCPSLPAYPNLKRFAVVVEGDSWRSRFGSGGRQFWYELLIRREGETREMHVGRVGKWLKALFRLEGVRGRGRVPGCLEVEFRLFWRDEPRREELKEGARVFGEALARFKR